ncbi:hypothetical protein KC887_07585 [Candidatus Kaiserbacteria bacterium]|nr:hypothetical protein [Candidatus Kaiserbacteria bacterium]
MIQRIKDFILEQRIAWHSEQLEAADFQWLKMAHYLRMQKLIMQRSPGQVERMERAKGLR